MGNRIRKGIIDSGVLVLPHDQRGRAQTQIDQRILQARKGAARNGLGALFPRIAFAHLVAQGATTQIGLDHTRLDLHKPLPKGRHQRRNTSALAVDQRP